jgi:hypothetical protein
MTFGCWTKDPFSTSVTYTLYICPLDFRIYSSKVGFDVITSGDMLVVA